MIITNDESITYVGGASSISAAFLAAAAKIITSVYGFGQNLGSAIHRFFNKNSCA